MENLGVKGGPIRVGAATYIRAGLRFIAGTGISLAVTDDTTEHEVEVTIANTSDEALSWVNL